MSIQRDIDAELRFHLDARVEELMAQGISRSDARTQAIAEFGDVNDVRADLQTIDRRVARKRSRADLLDSLRQDIAYAARSLRRTPAVSLTIIITLALGLGVNAAMFSLLDVIFLRPPAGVVDPGALRRVWAERRFSSGTEFWPGYDYSQYDALAKAVGDGAAITFYSYPERRKLGVGENVPTVAVAGTAANYFALLGVKPQAGRFYTADEARVNAVTPVVVISDAFWKRELDARPTAVGAQIRIANRRYTIIGVAPSGFAGTELDATDVWMPVPTLVGPSGPTGRPWWQDANVNGFNVLLRLRPDAHESELAQRSTVALRSRGTGYGLDTSTVAEFGSIVTARGPGSLKPAMQVATRLAGVALIVLLIACANVVNLLLARALRRRREIAVRLALGISRARLMRMLITESVLLAVLATIAAIIAAGWGGVALRGLLMPEVHFAESPLQWRVLAFALVVAVVAGAGAGLVPAIQSAAPDLTSALKAGSRDGVTHRSRLRSALVVCQAALSVVLLVGAVLFVRSLHNVKSHDIGYAVDRLAFASVRYDVPDSARDAMTPVRLREVGPRVASIPGVESVAFTSMRPVYGISFIDYHADVASTGEKLPEGLFTAVTPNYFSTIGTRLIRGHVFSRETGDRGPYSVIVNQAMADGIWPGQDPIGHCIYFQPRKRSPDPKSLPCSTVIGVVQTALSTSIGEKPQPQFYVSLDHMAFPTRGATSIIIRGTPSRLPAIQKSVSDLLRAEFPGGFPRLTTMSKVMEPEYRPWQLGATLFTLFGILALCVAAIGMYSTVSYAVSQRTHEFGVRVALGARGVDVLRQVLGAGIRTVALGVALGIVLALAAGRLIASLLYGIAPDDPAAITVVAAVLLGVAAIAALLPAIRAAKADPLSALRAE